MNEQTEYERICKKRSNWLIENTLNLKPIQVDAKIKEFDEKLEPYKNKLGNAVVSKSLDKYVYLTSGIAIASIIAMILQAILK